MPHQYRTRLALSKNSFSTRSFEQLEDRQLLAAWYAAPTGQASNTGAIDSPWDLATALTKVDAIDAGDTLFLRGGTYYHPNRAPGTKGYGFHLDGAAGAPVTIRPYQSEHVTIDGGLQSIDGTVSEHVVIMGLEVIVSENLTQNRVSAFSGSAPPSDLPRPWGGIDIRSGYDIKVVNNVVHANMQGIGIWGNVGGNSEVYGNVIYDNGWDAPDRKHGHGVYAQNATAEWKYVSDNLLFDNYSMQMQAYGSSAAFVDRFYVAENLFWSTGTSDSGALLIGGERPSQSVRVLDNIGYNGDLRIGYVNGGNDAVVTGNTVRGGISFTSWTNLTRSNNMSWPIGSGQPRLDGVLVAAPTSPLVKVNASALDSSRANVAILNYLGASQVAVDPTGFLQIGDTYQLLKPTDMWGAAVASGTYTGTPISVPVSGGFAAFVMTKSGSNTAPTISNIADSAVTVGTAVPLKSFTIGDAQTSAGSLTLTTLSSNAALVPLANLVFGGSGANRTLQVTPVAGATGSSTITVTVRDAGGLTASDTFLVTVNPASNTAPTISNIADSAVTLGTAVPLKSFTIGDAQTSAGSLTLTALSSNAALVPLANLVFGGSGANRTLQVTPVAGATGSSTITVTVRDAGGLTASDTFLVTINPASNTAPTISNIADSAVTLGTAVPLKSFTIGDAQTSAGSLTLTALSSNAALVPLANLVFGGSGANRTLQATPVAGATGSSTITVTVRDAEGLTANDTFVVTVNSNSANSPPTISNIADATVTLGTAYVQKSFAIGDVQTAVGALALSVQSSNTTLVPLANLLLLGFGSQRQLIVTPKSGLTGSSIITVTVRDAGGMTASDSFVFTVQSNSVSLSTAGAVNESTQPPLDRSPGTTSSLSALDRYFELLAATSKNRHRARTSRPERDIEREW